MGYDRRNIRCTIQLRAVRKYYLRALQLREELAKIDPDRFNPDLAESYRIFGVLKNDNKWLKKIIPTGTEISSGPTLPTNNKYSQEGF